MKIGVEDDIKRSQKAMDMYYQVVFGTILPEIEEVFESTLSMKLSKHFDYQNDIDH
jgi:hypothetical protein